MILTGEFHSLDTAWYYALRNIMVNGAVNMTEYRRRSKYYNAMLLEIDGSGIKLPKENPLGPKSVEQYVKQLSPIKADRPIGFAYTYGGRLYEYPSTSFDENSGVIDQIQWMSDQLSNHRFDSRRVQAITWCPDWDIDSKEDQPCFQRLWVYPHPNYKLDVSVDFRSWDMYGGFPNNIYAINKMVTEQLAEPNRFTIGKLFCHGNNCHVYEDDWEAVERMLNMKVV